MIFSLLGLGRAKCADVPSLASVLEAIRTKAGLPALGGAIFTTDGLVEQAAVGVRKRGTKVPVTTSDLWHLGSDTKAMTATLAGTFVAEGKLAWDAPVLSYFPHLRGEARTSMQPVTIAQVLRHRAGLTPNLQWWDLAKTGPLLQQRRLALVTAFNQPSYAPGQFHYANTDYVVIGAVLEKISGQPWEELMRQRLFTPLGMTSAGFLGTGTPGQIDQPWPHTANGKPTSSNGPEMDNAAIMAPAGAVHCTMEDWSKFLVDQLRGHAGMKALLPAEIYQAIQTAPPGTDYAFGWITAERDWAGGLALTHAGSNTMNYCVCWLAPEKKFGVLVCTNQAGDKASEACDEAASAMIDRYQAGAARK